MNKPLLDIRDLCVSGDGRPLLEGVSLCIAPAEIHALVGGNGCGKTSPAKAILGCAGYERERGEPP